jgi:hypothetical protein
MTLGINYILQNDIEDDNKQNLTTSKMALNVQYCYAECQYAGLSPGRPFQSSLMFSNVYG